MLIRRFFAVSLFLPFSLLVAGNANSQEKVYELEAPVTAIDLVAKSFVAGGVTVLVTPETEMETAGGKKAELSDLKINQVVEIEGTVMDGKWRAMEVEMQRKPLPIIGRKVDHGVEGWVDSVDLAKRMFRVGGVQVKVSESTEMEGDDDKVLRLEDLTVGDFVEVEGAFNAGKILEAREVEMGYDDDDDDDEDEDDDDDDDDRN